MSSRLRPLVSGIRALHEHAGGRGHPGVEEEAPGHGDRVRERDERHAHQRPRQPVHHHAQARALRPQLQRHDLGAVRARQ